MVQPTRAILQWEGDSLEVLKEWPRIVQHAFGASLMRLQDGQRSALRTRPMQSIGQDVFELKTADEAAWYRVIYLARIGDTIYVLDSFTKKSRKTEKNDLNRSKVRLTQVNRRLQEERTNAKRKSSQ
jgi:phage-related protein